MGLQLELEELFLFAMWLIYGVLYILFFQVPLHVPSNFYSFSAVLMNVIYKKYF
jgi:hypothetical protein